MATAVQVEALWNGLTDNNGDPLGGGKVFTYAAGTTTPVSLFTNSDKSTSATNPVILDGYGRAQVWADGRYKFVVKTSADVTLYTLDNLLYGFDDSQLLWGGLSTGSANAQLVSTIATTTAYSNGLRLSFVAGYTNTGATTVTVNALTAVSIVKGPLATALQAGDIVAGQLVSCTYYGGSFRLEDFPTLADVTQGRARYVSNAAGTNTITGTLSPAPAQYEAGMTVCFKAASSNTGATTINLNSLGAKTIQRYGVALVGGEISANDMVEIIYDGTQFQLVNVAPNPIFLDRANSRVGIGTTDPAYAFAVEGTSVATSAITNTRYAADTNATEVILRKSRGASVGTNTTVNNNDNIGSLGFYGADGTTYKASSRIIGAVDAAVSAGIVPGRLSFQTANTSGVLAERMLIDSSGNVGIGAAPAASTTRVTVKGTGTTTNKAISVQDSSGTETFGVRDNGYVFAVGSYNSTTASAVNLNIDSGGNLQRSTSSIRYKTNVQDNPHGLSKVLQLRSVTYKGINDGDTVFGGLIAEEVHALGLSEYVMYNENGEPEGLAYGNMVSLLAKAVQELAARVEALEAQLGG